MKIAVDARQMKQMEKETIEGIGIPSIVLMERAALALAEETAKKVTKAGKRGTLCPVRIAAVCGSGNNGGDGVAAARLLYLEGYDASVLLAFLPEGKVKEEDFTSLSITEELKKQLQIALRIGVPVYGGGNTADYPVLIDALFGIGLTREIGGAYAELIGRINQETHWVLSADIPSGISAADGRVQNVAVRADKTVTFGFMKRGLLLYPGAEYAGEVCLRQVGIVRGSTPVDFFYYEEEELDALLPKRPAYSNKGTFGKVVTVAGSKNMSGAAYFSAAAAYRTGAGLVRLLTVECNREILQKRLPEAMLTTYEENADRETLKKLAEGAVEFADACVIGPGLSTSATARELTEELLFAAGNKGIPCVVDADALNLLAERVTREAGEKASGKTRMALFASYLPKNAVITPHLGELSRIMALSAKQIADSLLDVAADCTYNNEIIAVIKDARTIVAKGTKRYLNVAGNQGMATAGSGDVLTGIIAAFLAAGMEPYEAACVGCFVHGLAGDLAAKSRGHASLMAEDLLTAISELLKQIEGKAENRS